MKTKKWCENRGCALVDIKVEVDDAVTNCVGCGRDLKDITSLFGANVMDAFRRLS